MSRRWSMTPPVGPHYQAPPSMAFDKTDPPGPDHHGAPAPVTAFWEDQACALVDYHAPRPVMTEFHHRKPVFLQNRLYGHVVYGPELWVCGNCHDAVHAWLYWLLGERRQPPWIGRAARAEAERTHAWFLAEASRLGVTV